MLELLDSESYIPTEEDLIAYEGLRNIRFRRDSALEVGLFLNPEDKSTVVTIKNVNDVIKPFVFPVSKEEANSAFTEPYPHAPVVGRIMMEEMLGAKPELAAA